MAHAETLEEYDVEMSEKWIFLWNLYLVSTFIALAGVFFISFITTIASIISSVASIIKIVYLYKTVKLYGKYLEENAEVRKTELF